MTDDENKDLQGAGSENSFSIPDEYLERGWAQNFQNKSGDDLKNEFFKSYDNSQSLIGKKVQDFITTTDLKSLDNFEEIKKSLSDQLGIGAPEVPEDYAINDLLKDADGNASHQYPDELINRFTDVFKELGLTKEQGQRLFDYFTKFEIEEYQKATDGAVLDAKLDKIFSGDKAAKTSCETLIKEFLSDEDKAFLDKYAPNEFIEIIYKLSKNFSEKYDYKEKAAPPKGAGNTKLSKEERTAEYKRLNEKLMSLKNALHSDKEEQEIIDQMEALFK